MTTLKRPLPPIDPASTALILIDLQRGIVPRQLSPRSGPDVVQAANRLTPVLRNRGGLIIRVNVSYGPDGGAALKTDVDEQPATPFPEGWDEFVDEAKPIPGDVVITKRQWGAFYGTDLDLQLRRRKRTTIILGGIATNFGVESTARDAWERGYQLILPEDLMAASSIEAHEASLTRIFPRLGRICQTDDVVRALG
jgi:nicotinamidase-related amidase